MDIIINPHSISTITKIMIIYLEYSGQRQHQPTRRTDQKHRGHIQQKCGHCITQQHGRTDLREVIEWRKALGEWEDHEVDDRAYGCVVMHRDKGIHFKTVQKDLDHDKPRGFELMNDMDMSVNGR
jgi:hypothetical protein